MIKFENKDCILGMKEMEECSVDLTVTSPPYDNLRDYKGDSQWNASIWEETLRELYRVTKDGGVVVWIVNDATIKGSETGTSFKQALYAMECGFRLHDTMIWKKPNTPFPSTNRYYQTFEYMFIFSKGAPKTVNLLRDRKNKYAGHKRKAETKCNFRTSNRKNDSDIQEYGVRHNVWEMSANTLKSTHPATFPHWLVNDHILTWSNKGDTVFDPFTGSGTTLIKADELERNAIGFEFSEEYYNDAITKNPHLVE